MSERACALIAARLASRLALLAIQKLAITLSTAIATATDAITSDRNQRTPFAGVFGGGAGGAGVGAGADLLEVTDDSPHWWLTFEFTGHAPQARGPVE